MQRLLERVPLIQGAPGQQVHQQIDVTVRPQAAVEGADDVRVGQRAQNRDLAQGSLRMLGHGDRLARELERKRALVARRVHLVDPGERTDAQHAEDAKISGVYVPSLEVERHRS